MGVCFSHNAYRNYFGMETMLTGGPCYKVRNNSEGLEKR
jgi:hypothetical protein